MLALHPKYRTILSEIVQKVGLCYKGDFYAGIGSRDTPKNVLEFMRNFAEVIGHSGLILRSGGASGADEAFKMGCYDKLLPMEIYLPWPTFIIPIPHKNALFYNNPAVETFSIAGQFHPNWNNLTIGVKKLHARNVHQILGPKIGVSIPSKFVLCWTKDGANGVTVKTSHQTGGTGQAIRIAAHYDVSVINLRNYF
jgi:hypothetical protein